MADKETTRAVWRKKTAAISITPPWGKAAEKLRGLPQYRKAATVFATPGKSLQQGRINCLADGKNLVMPAPSIREGFFLIPGRTVPYKDLSAAATYKGLEKYGQLLKGSGISDLAVDLLLCDSLVIDQQGGRLGDGNGFFDLCCGLLQEYGCLQQDWTAFTFLLDEQVSATLLPMDQWDIKMAGAVTPTRLLFFEAPAQNPLIYWDALPKSRIRRIDPLWKLFQVKGER